MTDNADLIDKLRTQAALARFSHDPDPMYVADLYDDAAEALAAAAEENADLRKHIAVLTDPNLTMTERIALLEEAYADD